MIELRDKFKSSAGGNRGRSALAAVVLLSLAVAGCDKCGNHVNLNTPAIQHSCEDNTQPAR